MVRRPRPRRVPRASADPQGVREATPGVASRRLRRLRGLQASGLRAAKGHPFR
ncbi:hypothetical protein A176_004625 [Myxococcus hansupus]|uniref:Uncharacterized protein n=1 Tax=Pseudomyxococcus hansupus TaxID=1297742 RepID=A0A0H4X1H8_9BACT|nr:hypothetical protein A176_004625 [Myxococcus hansupus]